MVYSFNWFCYMFRSWDVGHATRTCRLLLRVQIITVTFIPMLIGNVHACCKQAAYRIFFALMMHMNKIQMKYACKTCCKKNCHILRFLIHLLYGETRVTYLANMN